MVVSTSEKTLHEHEHKGLLLFEEVIVICSENYTKPIHVLCGENVEL